LTADNSPLKNNINCWTFSIFKIKYQCFRYSRQLFSKNEKINSVSFLYDIRAIFPKMYDKIKCQFTRYSNEIISLFESISNSCLFK
jgi:hypothetical protein